MKLKNTFKGIVFVFSVVALNACNTLGIEGSWVEPVPGMPDKEQGFILEKGGKATSINMATLQYEGWMQKDDLLILSGKSIGNRQTIPFSDTLTIKKVTNDKLIVEDRGTTRHYSRPGKEGGKEGIPASVLTPVKSVLKVEGDLIIGHEVRSFTAKGDSLSYWIVDKTGELLQEYDQLIGGVKNSVPVYVELEVMDMGKSDEGFAASYKGVYHVVKIHKMVVQNTN